MKIEEKRCQMCNHEGGFYGPICSRCHVWWNYHFKRHSHGPTYFVQYVELKERALRRAHFVVQKDSRSAVHERESLIRQSHRKKRRVRIVGGKAG